MDLVFLWLLALPAQEHARHLHAAAPLTAVPTPPPVIR